MSKKKIVSLKEDKLIKRFGSRELAKLFMYQMWALSKYPARETK